jgi:hypothetical protein
MDLVISYPNILFATLVMALVGLLWRFGLFGKQWMQETGHTVRELMGRRVEAVRALLSFVLLTFVMALAIALLIGLTHPQGLSGVFILALVIVSGCIILPQLERVLFEKRPWKLGLISLGEYGLMIITGACVLMYLG